MIIDLCLFLAVFLALYIFTMHFLHKIRNLPPSPFPSIPIIGHLYLLKKPLHRTLFKISDRYGPVLFLQFGSRKVLLVSSASAAEECFTTNDVAFANRPHLLAGKHLGYNDTILPFASYGDHWRNLRRIATVEVLSSNRLQMLASIRVDEMQSMVLRILRDSTKDPNQAVEIKSVFFDVTLNVMMRMIARKQYYGDSAAAAKFQAIVAETFILSSVTNVADFLPFLNWIGIGGLENKLTALQKKRDGSMQYLIEESRKWGIEDSDRGGRKRTMIEVLLSLQQTDPGYYTDEIIRGLMLVMLMAGTDTSSNTMEWAMSLLLNNPDILKKSQAEIDKEVGYDHLVDDSDMTQLPYLQCVIKETLRMFPAVPLLIPHESSRECTVGGFHIPRGTMLLANVCAIQNDPKVWVDPEKFMPERFQGIQGDSYGFKFMPFGSGRRSCPGEMLAMKLVGTVLGSLIQCFEWERVSEKMVDLREGEGITLNKAEPVIAKCRPRPTMLKLLSQI